MQHLDSKNQLKILIASTKRKRTQKKQSELLFIYFWRNTPQPQYSLSQKRDMISELLFFSSVLSKKKERILYDSRFWNLVFVEKIRFTNDEKKHKRVMKQADRNKINDKPDIFLFAD